MNWLIFNDRVLQEAADQSNPLYEWLKFIAIFSSNLDEFFRVRISQLRQLKRVKKSIRKKLALEPSTFIKELLHKVHEQQNYLGNIFFDSLVPELKENGIHLLSYEALVADHADLYQRY
jgi:polyphosphate kinase